MSRVVVGADVGGTSTRVAVADLSGTVLGAAQESGGNPNSVGLQMSTTRIRTALEQALARARPGSAPEVGAVVLGMAGYNTALAAGPAFLRDALGPYGHGEQLATMPRIVSDFAVAYASGSPLAHGYVVIAGTGSGAAEIDHGDIVGRRGGWGWLLGDEGGAFWLGREAVRQALTEVQAGQGRSDLTRQVIDRLGVDTQNPLPGLLRIPYERTSVALAELAPLVTGLVDSDPAAASIAARAAEFLAGLVLDLDPRPGRPVVVTGSVLQSATAIRQAFANRIDGALGSPVLTAESGLVGALWLAIGDVEPAPDPAVHARLAATFATLDQQV